MRDEIRSYLHHLSAERNASPHTLRNYESDLEELRDFLAAGRKRRPLAIRRVSTEDLRAYAAAKLRNCRRATVARKVSAIRGFFAFVVQAGKIRHDPAAGLVAPKIEKRLPVFLPIDDTERLLNGMPAGEAWAERDRAMLETLYATGLRVSELVGLDWAHVDFENECVRAFGKGRKERIVPIGEIALDALQSYRRALAEAGLRADAGVRQSPRTATDHAQRRRGSSSATRSDPARRSRRARTRCATALPPTCSAPGPICVRSRSCSATSASRPRRSTPT